MTERDNTTLMHGDTVHLAITTPSGITQASGAITGVTYDPTTGNILSLEIGGADNPATTHSPALHAALLTIAKQRDNTASAVARAALDKALNTLSTLQPTDRATLGLPTPDAPAQPAATADAQP